MIIADKTGPLLTIVVAVAQNGVIGRDGGLAWKISDDLKWFKRMTVGKPVIMGRKTYESIGRALPDRANIVISRQPDFVADGCRVRATIADALEEARRAARATGVVEICIIGGAEIYRQTLPAADRIFYTKILADVEGDVTFPAFDADAFRKVAVGGAAKSKKNEHSCEFFILDRRRHQ